MTTAPYGWTDKNAPLEPGEILIPHGAKYRFAPGPDDDLEMSMWSYSSPVMSGRGEGNNAVKKLANGVEITGKKIVRVDRLGNRTEWFVPHAVPVVIHSDHKYPPPFDHDMEVVLTPEEKAANEAEIKDHYAKEAARKKADKARLKAEKLAAREAKNTVVVRAHGTSTGRLKR